MRRIKRRMNGRKFLCRMISRHRHHIVADAGIAADHRILDKAIRTDITGITDPAVQKGHAICQTVVPFKLIRRIQLCLSFKSDIFSFPFRPVNTLFRSVQHLVQKSHNNSFARITPWV